MTTRKLPKIGIALGGGGAKGFAHIGALKAFRDEGIEFDIVTGTSIGALVGAVYAAGNLDQLAQRASEISLTDIPLLLSPAFSRSGFFTGKSALDYLQDLLQFETIDELPKPFAAVSVDILTGEPEIFTKGNLREAVRASISIPAVFTPVQFESRVLVDGGLVEPGPVEICRAIGADIVVAIDLFGLENSTSAVQAQPNAKPPRMWPAGLANALTYLHSISNRLHVTDLLPAPKDATPKQRRKALSIIDIIEGTLAVTQRQLTQYRLAQHPPDLLIQPAVADVGMLDFHRGSPVIALGEQAAKAAIPTLRKLIA